MIEIGGPPLTLDDLVKVSRQNTPLRLADSARERMKKSREVVESAIRDNRAIYGVTTGFGELKDRRIPPDQLRQLQLNLLRSHAAGEIGRASCRGRV